ncbi:STAS domain-containing protein [Thermopolyspora sp. NPDC052614]|uniref:STAS domain-containing protein n=1 Tax=Thermopolyspora sp. NPDC052614 TaxID=3155682 RepID=UPI0034479E56
MEVQVEQQANCTVLYLDGEIDTFVAPRVRECIADVWAQTSTPLVVIDLARVTFCDAAGVKALLFALKIMQATNRRLVLCGVGRRMELLLRVSGVKDLFEVHDSVEDVLDDLFQQSWPPSAVPGGRAFN